MIVTKDEHKYVQFFNEANPITTRMHSLQLLPGIGKTLMWALLEERKREPFKNFEDIAARTKLQNPKKVISARIIDELKEEFQGLLTQLEKNQVEYDLGSESIIMDHGSINENKFVVGSREYDLVVLPPMFENLMDSTYQLILILAKS